MKKTIFLITLNLVCILNLFSITPHINKGKLEPISMEQACQEMKISAAEIKDLNKKFYGYFESFDFFPELEELVDDTNYEIYRQSFSETNEVLYRVLFYTHDIYNKEKLNLFQKIYYSNKTDKANLLFADYYDGLVDYLASSYSKVQLNTNLMPIIRNHKISGIMIYGIESYTSYKHTDEYESPDEISNEKTTHRANVFWSNNFATMDLTYRKDPDVIISCSKPLLDEKDVFKYTIQNAFDKNPATSYVEDTYNDMMDINIGVAGELQKVAIINGYAANESLYRSNNSIKQVLFSNWLTKEVKRVFDEQCILKENTLTYQFIERKNTKDKEAGTSFKVVDVYRGTRYSDTCIAELDYYIDSNGWLFGDIDE
ncbi:NADase-type glycan-binding domain-containing protein [Treponema sp.]|uniref:NADase-type glycan-binding domain-containing protein n=1 Tax=Treponema sp. TaxID=166 RepID=UPI00298D99B4|nr:hypothetical protein [Treponema sp.]MCQ2242202.1 hypothetical protein [Treponema sp.]